MQQGSQDALTEVSVTANLLDSHSSQQACEQLQAGLHDEEGVQGRGLGAADDEQRRYREEACGTGG